jgi:hypothetical protein
MSIKWVVGGKNSLGTAQIAYSTDGITYTNAANAPTIFGQYVRSIVHNSSIWVAGGTSNGGSTFTIGYSYDAITWYGSSSGNAILSSGVTCVTYGDGKFLAIGGGPTYVAMYSTDGINWTGTMPNTTWNGWGMGAIYKNSLYVICGGAGFGSTNKMIAYSSDAINWTFATTTILSAETRMIEYDGTGKWVAVGVNAINPSIQVQYASSISGTWTSSICPYSNRANFVKWGNGKFIINGYDTNTIYTSTDGANWTAVNSANFSTMAGAINYNNNLWLMGQSAATKPLLYSTDNGATWGICTVPTPSIIYGIAYSVPPPLAYPCFLEGTKILRMNPETDEEEYIAVEKLRRGDLIKTLLDGYKAIHSIGHKILPNPATDKDKRNRLYRFSKQKCPDVNRDLYITGEHCTLRLYLTYDQVEQIKDHMGRYYITDKHFRCPACLDERAEPYDREDKPVTIWHFALEHYDAYLNYGIYANGLLVESCSIEYLVKKSNMKLV